MRRPAADASRRCQGQERCASQSGGGEAASAGAGACSACRDPLSMLRWILSQSTVRNCGRIIVVGRVNSNVNLPMTDYIQVLTTVGTKAAAQDIAEMLLREKLAACVQIVGPIESRYWWEGNLETAEEWQCLVKSRLQLYARLEAAIRHAHSYEVPEIIVSRIETGNPAYLDWLQQELSD